MPHRLSLAILLCVVTTLFPGSPAAGAPVEYDAIAMARQDLKLGFTVGGKVKKVNVTAGQSVKAGHQLIQLEDEEKRSLVEVYEIRAASDLEYQAAIAKQHLADLEEARLVELVQKNAAAKFELERAHISAVVAKLESELAKRTTAEISEQLRQAKAQLDQYTLKAPETGFIDEITVADGEMVEAGKPVLRLVVADPLWVEVAVPTNITMSLKEGDPAWVRIKLPGQEQPVQGKILYLRQVADSAADRRLVRIEISNPKLLPAGVSVGVTFESPVEAKP